MLDGIVIDDTRLFNKKLKNGKTSIITTDLIKHRMVRYPTTDLERRQSFVCKRSNVVPQFVC